MFFIWGDSFVLHTIIMDDIFYVILFQQTVEGCLVMFHAIGCRTLFLLQFGFNHTVVCYILS